MDEERTLHSQRHVQNPDLSAKPLHLVGRPLLVGPQVLVGDHCENWQAGMESERVRRQEISRGKTKRRDPTLQLAFRETFSILLLLLTLLDITPKRDQYWSNRNLQPDQSHRLILFRQSQYI